MPDLQGKNQTRLFCSICGKHYYKMLKNAPANKNVPHRICANSVKRYKVRHYPLRGRWE